MGTNKKARMLDFEKMIDKGGDQFTAQTANGTAKWKGTGWNKDYDWQREQLPPDPTRPEGRNNRTGE